MDVSVHLQALAVLPPEKDLISLEYDAGYGPRASLDIF